VVTLGNTTKLRCEGSISNLAVQTFMYQIYTQSLPEFSRRFHVNQRDHHAVATIFIIEIPELWKISAHPQHMITETFYIGAWMSSETEAGKMMREMSTQRVEANPATEIHSEFPGQVLPAFIL
jgi:hypothetical protein